MAGVAGWLVGLGEGAGLDVGAIVVVGSIDTLGIGVGRGSPTALAVGAEIGTRLGVGVSPSDVHAAKTPVRSSPRRTLEFTDRRPTRRIGRASPTCAM
jgi:hypothetical protein